MKLAVSILSAAALAVHASVEGANEAASPAPFSHRLSVVSQPLTKQSHRDESIPLLAATTGDEVDRMLRRDCESGFFRLDLTTDNYGFETSWVLEARDDGGSWADVEAGPPEGRRYAPNNRYVGLYCLEPGEYRFTIYDMFTDGMCCSFGEGGYAGYIDGTQQFADDGSNWAKRSHRFSVAAPSSVPQPKSAVDESEEEPSMTARDSEWLDSHNVRRKEWHERYNTTYVPLEWSNSLKESSQVWADHLLDSCGEGMFHDPDTPYGENVAGNSGSGSWGEVKPTEKILYRFVEREANWSYPKNSHLTQVLWRATKYVGCAEASKPKEGGGMCHTQVCRYARPGNCNMGKHRDDGEWWLEPMLMDDSPCGPARPTDARA